jgi:CRP-like cAMP-binding protein
MIKIILLKKNFKKGDVVFREGDDGNEAYIVRSGYVSILKTDADKEVELATRGPGEIVGEMALIDDSPRSATLAAKTDIELEIITRTSLKEMMQDLPDPIVTIVHQLLERLRDTNELVPMDSGD